ASLAAGGSVAQSASRTAPASGTYYVCVIADNFDTSGQTGTTPNNDLVIAGPFTVQSSSPDLIPQNISVTPNPASPNGAITVNWTLANQGGATASASTTVVRVESSNTCPVVAQAQVS